MGRTKVSPEEKEAKQKAKKEADEIARLLIMKERSLTDLRKFPPSAKTPTFKFKVGDLVQEMDGTGSASKKIVEVLDNGTILLLENQNDYVSHMRLIPEDKVAEVRKENFSFRDLTHMSFHNTRMDNLLSYYYNFRVDMSPAYQRELVWTLEDKQSLINSIFNNIEIGKFVLIERDYDDEEFSYEILDGKQRLNALTEFIENKFQYNGFYYYQLSNRDKHHFKGYSVTYGTSRQDLSLEQKCAYFLKLNTQGQPQSQEHLNKVMEMLRAEQAKKKTE